MPARCRRLATKQAARQLRPPDFESSLDIIWLLAEDKGGLGLFPPRPSSLSSSLSLSRLERNAPFYCLYLHSACPSVRPPPPLLSSFRWATLHARCFLPSVGDACQFSFLTSFLFQLLSKLFFFSLSPISNDSIESDRRSLGRDDLSFYRIVQNLLASVGVISCVSIYTNVTSIAELAIIIYRWCRLNTDDNHIGTMVGRAYWTIVA